jgi:hypothetical protein
MMSDEAAEEFLLQARKIFLRQKRLAERAVEQLSYTQLHERIHPNTNSVSIIMKHMAGNMLSRWTDFLTTDGEKPWRHRENEFVDDLLVPGLIERYWEHGWVIVFEALSDLNPDDLTRTILIRGEEHSVIQAIQRQVDHYGYHVGQIVLIAKILVGEEWQSLSIPPGGSVEFNEMKRRASDFPGDSSKRH